MRLHTLSVLCLALTAGCADMPDLGAGPGQTTLPYPKIMPVDQVLAGTTSDPEELAKLEKGTAAIAYRSARLRARAAAMTGPVLDEPTIRRLAETLARHPA